MKISKEELSKNLKQNNKIAKVSQFVENKVKGSIEKSLNSSK